MSWSHSGGSRKRAAIVLFLGGVHLAYTFLTRTFSRTEEQLETAMKQTAPRISSDMTMWKAWIGFHVSHSMGLMLFGLVYGYMCRSSVWRNSGQRAGQNAVNGQTILSPDEAKQWGIVEEIRDNFMEPGAVFVTVNTPPSEGTKEGSRIQHITTGN